jgi:hypothetical protein
VVEEKGEAALSEQDRTRYLELTSIFAKNAIPRSQEITGEDGEPIEAKIISAVNYVVPRNPTENPDTETNLETAPSLPSAE